MLDTEADSFGKDLNGILKVKVTVRCEHSACGADIKSNPLRALGLALCCGTARVVDCRTDDRLKLVLTKFEAVCPKGVGVDNV